MEDFDSDSLQHGCFFDYKGYQRLENPIPSGSYNLNPNSSKLSRPKSMIEQERERIKRMNFANFCESTNSPYLLEMLQDMHQVMIVHHRSLSTIDYERFESVKGLKISKGFSEHLFDGRDGDNIMMARLSTCGYQMALVYPSKISIAKTSKFLTTRSTYKLVFEVEFVLSEGKYVYLEWPKLTQHYLDKVYFLTLDDQGNLRIHFVKEGKEEIIRKGEKFHSATFSLNGECIYAINHQQEIFKIDFYDSRILIKRKIQGLSNPEEVMSSHIKQLTPWIFAIGSMMKIEDGANFKPYLHVICGDMSDPKEELKIKIFEMLLLPDSADPNKTVVFRSFYIKQRHLLLFGHTRSNKILALYFGFDGSIQEIEGLNLGSGALRGIILAREDVSYETRNKPRSSIVENQNRKLKLPLSPQIWILDSNTAIHHFNYFDTRFSAPAFALIVRPFRVTKFIEKEKYLSEKLVPRKKFRCSSLGIRRALTVLERKKSDRSRSLSSPKTRPIEIIVNGNARRISALKINQKPPKIRAEKSNFASLFKGSERSSLIASNKESATQQADNKPAGFVSLSQNKQLLFAPHSIKTDTTEAGSTDIASLFKTQEKTLFTPLTEAKETGQKPRDFINFNPPKNKSLLVSQNSKAEIKEADHKPIDLVGLNPSQNKSGFVSQNNEIKTKEIDNKPNLFSSPRNPFSSKTTTINSLFDSSSKSKPSFAFEKKVKEGEESNSSLISQLAIKSKTTLDASNLFSSNAPSKTFLKVFATPEDPAKKKTFLFLNKLESDVLFKVENDEFPAHRYILSEKCKFFKNMFASGMLESYSSVIEMTGMKASVFKAFLEYVYKGQTLLTEELALNLIDLSERYIIHEMKLACEEYLQCVLSLDNCIKIYETADLYDAVILKKWTLLFFKNHIDKIMERRDFENVPKMIYILLYKIKWDEKVVIGPPLSELIVE